MLQVSPSWAKCPTFKRKTATIEVVQEEDDKEDCEPSNKEAPHISAVVMNMEVE